MRLFKYWLLYRKMKRQRERDRETATTSFQSVEADERSRLRKNERKKTARYYIGRWLERKKGRDFEFCQREGFFFFFLLASSSSSHQVSLFIPSLNEGNVVVAAILVFEPSTWIFSETCWLAEPKVSYHHQSTLWSGCGRIAWTLQPKLSSSFLFPNRTQPVLFTNSRLSIWPRTGEKQEKKKHKKSISFVKTLWQTVDVWSVLRRRLALPAYRFPVDIFACISFGLVLISSWSDEWIVAKESANVRVKVISTTVSTWIHELH